VFTLPIHSTDVFLEDLRVTVPVRETTVSAVDSPLFQLEGEEVRRSPDGTLAVLRVAQPGRLTWLARGIDTDGNVTQTVELSMAGGHRASVLLRSPVEDDQLAKVAVGLGRKRSEVAFAAGEPRERRVTLDACRREGAVAGRIDLQNAAHIGNNRFSGARVMAVRLEKC
jgi:hypothetical protein